MRAFSSIHYSWFPKRLSLASRPLLSGIRQIQLQPLKGKYCVGKGRAPELTVPVVWHQGRCHATSIKVESRAQCPTIYALSTAPGTAAIAIVRLSGPACKEVYHAMCPNTRLPKARYAAHRSLHVPYTMDTRTGLLDSSAIILFFPSPNSVTGEDVLELHIHGGRAVTAAVLAAVAKCSSPAHNIRYAEPGEFTRRAFFNDRLNLLQIEALGDTLAAVTEEQRRIAVQGTNGSLAARYEGWRQLLLSARGELEALIDFSEDQHFDESPSALASSVAEQISMLRAQIVLHVSNAVRGELLRTGIALAFLGAPNAGKSSLLNQLVGRDAAIVSPQAGTTRDVVEVGLDIGGFFCRLSDTAGLRGFPSSSTGQYPTKVGDIEREGIRRAKARARESDVVILMLSFELAFDSQVAQLQIESEVVAAANELLAMGKTVLVVINKVDRLDGDLTIDMMKDNFAPQLLHALPKLRLDNVYFTSCKDALAVTSVATSVGADVGGIGALANGLTATFKELTSAVHSSATTDVAGADNWHEALGATARQRALLQECVLRLDDFLVLVRNSNNSSTTSSELDCTNNQAKCLEESRVLHRGPQAEIEVEVDIVAAAEELRAAASCLSRITARGEAGDVEEVLGVVFEK